VNSEVQGLAFSFVTLNQAVMQMCRWTRWLGILLMAAVAEQGGVGTPFLARSGTTSAAAVHFRVASQHMLTKTRTSSTCASAAAADMSSCVAVDESELIIPDTSELNALRAQVGRMHCKLRKDMHHGTSTL
jgi:hypothetical protein